MLKSAVVFFHKNIHAIYKPEWIRDCINSIANQTVSDVAWFELDYGGAGIQYTNTENFESIPMSNHIEAMNYLYTKLFGLGYDVVFNTNCDDVYHPKRFELQLKAIEEGAQLVSSNFNHRDENWKIVRRMRMSMYKDIKGELERGHNILAHPVTAMHRSFWDTTYNDLLGYEDLDLWVRQIKAGKKFVILPEYLLDYRLHNAQITKTYGDKGKLIANSNE